MYVYMYTIYNNACATDVYGNELAFAFMLHSCLPCKHKLNVYAPTPVPVPAPPTPRGALLVFVVGHCSSLGCRYSLLSR